MRIVWSGRCWTGMRGHRFLRKARGDVDELGLVERPLDADSTGQLDCDPSNLGRRTKISAHKFGGASVSDAQAIQRVGQLLQPN